MNPPNSTARKPPALRKKTPSPTAGAKLMELKCFPEARQMLIEGQPVPVIAEFIQVEKGEYAGASRDSVIRALYRFKDTIPPADLLAARLPTKHVEALRQVKEGLDELAELKQLYTIQSGRIAKLQKTEAELPTVLFPTLSNEIRIAIEILRESAAVKKTMGIYRTDGPPGEPAPSAGMTPEKLLVEVDRIEKTYDSAAAGRVMRDPEAVHRVVSVYRTLQLVAKSTTVTTTEPSTR